MHIHPHTPAVASDNLRATHSTAPSVEGAMLQAMRGGEKVQSPAAVELIAATARTMRYASPDGTGRMVDTYA